MSTKPNFWLRPWSYDMTHQTQTEPNAMMSGHCWQRRSVFWQQFRIVKFPERRHTLTGILHNVICNTKQGNFKCG